MTGRLRALRDWRVRPVATVWDYPWFTVERTFSKRAPTVLLTGGMHGEEPAGVEGVLRWLESDRWRKYPVNWLVFPCINPYGWERNQRRNRQRRDINRQFRQRTNTPEAELIKRLVKGRRFEFSLEFHEDVDATGFYLYELRRQPPYIGEQILSAVARVTPINRDSIIDGNEATGHGLIRREVDVNLLRTRQRWPMAFHLYQHCTDHILGSESALTVPLATRARAHVVALEFALSLSFRAC
ncbi:MAG: M14 family metallocarboxypeptidase [Verrucomicrobiota bacterium]